ncbi:MAG: sugar kinase [Deltaproteobacteria bacterium]|nr:sugar kinase [Deltaproteobacteria bacterium]
MSVLVVGSLALDDIETPAEKRTGVLGGSAVYFSAAASLLDHVRMVGVVGDDFPEHALADLEKKGVDTRGVMKRPGRTFHWSGRYHENPNDRDTLETVLGVFAEFEPQLPAEYADSEMVFLANIDPGLQLKVLDMMDSPGFVALDTMNYWIEGKPGALEKVLERVDTLLINDSEAELLSRRIGLPAAAREIRSMGPKTVVIKLGKHGALVFREDDLFYAPGLPMDDVKDPTGAGDSFAGGFVAALSLLGYKDNDNYRRAAIIGSAAASFTIQGFGVEALMAADRDDLAGRAERFVDLSRIPMPILPVK